MATPRSTTGISKIMFPAGFVSASLDFMLHFHFQCVASATIDRNLDE